MSRIKPINPDDFRKPDGGISGESYLQEHFAGIMKRCDLNISQALNIAGKGNYLIAYDKQEGKHFILLGKNIGQQQGVIGFLRSDDRTGNGGLINLSPRSAELFINNYQCELANSNHVTTCPVRLDHLSHRVQYELKKQALEKSAVVGV